MISLQSLDYHRLNKSDLVYPCLKLSLISDPSIFKRAGRRMSRIRLRHDQAESSIASKTFFAAEHLSALVVSAAICSRSSTSIWPILNFVTRMPVMTASLCFAFLANFPPNSLARISLAWPSLVVAVAVIASASHSKS